MSSSSSDYLLLFRGNHWDQRLSPEEIQQVMSRWSAWYDRLEQTGKIRGANPLHPRGKVVSGKEGRTISDGPFAEAKETIGGYFLLADCDEEEALAIARDCPALDYGMKVEVRPVAERCQVAERAARAQPADAAAAP